MVRVTFIDVDGEKRLGAADLPREKLPAEFTTIELLGDHWQIVSHEYTSSTQLTLRLKKLQQIDPRDILFSLPTVCDALPAVDESRDGANVLELFEDDWRQLEFVAPELQSVVEAQFEAIRKVPRSGLGFQELHLRKEPARPLLERQIALPQGRRLDGVRFRSGPGLVREGFAIDVGGAIAYGVPGILAISAPKKLELGDLLLVDWVATKIL